MSRKDLDERIELCEKFINTMHPWEEKFAWFPVGIDRRLIWLRKYYERRPVFMSYSRCERVLTVLDMLKNG